MSKSLHRKKQGRISVREARDLYRQLRGDRPVDGAHWNWFRVGVTLAQTGKVSWSDVAWLQAGPISPARWRGLRAEFRQILREQKATEGAKG